MKRLLHLGLLILIGCVWLMPLGDVVSAQDADETATAEAQGDAAEEVELSDDELAALMTRVDRFFIDQDMADLTVDVDIYRDPSNRLDERNIREGNPSRIAGLSTIVSHYAYEYPDYYLLTIMGEVLAGSEAPEERIFFSQLLPMPGAPIYTQDIRDRFDINFQGMDDVEGVPVYKVRYSAKDRDTEFFDYIIYYIGVEPEVILRVESAFDNLWYVGSGRGNFYYDNWLGKYLPIYGHGTVSFYPNRRFNVWGRWYRWNWQTAEEAGIGTPQESAPVETENSSEGVEGEGSG